jgi:hypothetical protein
VRQLAFLHGRRGELQGGQGIGPLQVREVGDELGIGQPCGELAQNGAHGHPGVADAGQPAHPSRVDGNPIAFTKRLAAADVSGSAGTVGDAYDNALPESVIGLFKTGLIKPRGPWRTAGRSSSPRWSTWTGSTRGGSTRPTETFRPQN